jgi:predicted ATPase
MPIPYIKQVHVNDCYTYQNIDIPIRPLTAFRHIVLTGKNGSGKTTILNRIAFQLSHFVSGKTKQDVSSNLQNLILGNPQHPHIFEWQAQLVELNGIALHFLEQTDSTIIDQKNKFLFSFYKANRKVEFEDVKTVISEDELLKKLGTAENNKSTISQLKQYLVNKKVYQAFDMIDNRQESIQKTNEFFNKVQETLSKILKDPKLELIFIHERFEFYIKYSDGRKVTFNQLSEGFSAFMSIMADLFVRADIIQKTNNDYVNDIHGIVLIDEPETHFHLSMQYEILPLITNFFPKVQLIIATHSPAVISSLQNATVFDLTSKEEVADWLLGSSYSDLMIRHFGLENEFSPIADKIIADISVAVKEKNKEKLEAILETNANYLTPSLRLEIESQIVKINTDQR